MDYKLKKYQKNVCEIIINILILILFLFCLNKVSSAKNIYIGVASNFFGPIKIIKEDFKNKTGQDIVITRGSSGSL